MHIFSPDTINHLLSTYGYGAIFLLVMLESSGIPLPGETVLVSAAIYASTTHSMDIRFIVGCAAAGAILGDNIGFWVGRAFGQRVLTRWGPGVGLDARKQKLGQYLFMTYGGAIVFFGRFVAVLRAFAALLAGVNRLSPWRFLVFNAAGGILWSCLFGFGSYGLGEGIHRIAGPIGWIALGLALLGAIALWWFFKKHEDRLLAKAEEAMDRHPVP